MKKLTTGFYTPTESFKSIPLHIAVMFEDDCTLVAVVGAADDDAGNLEETNRYAELFAKAPELEAQNVAQAAEIEKLRADAEMTVEKLRQILFYVGNQDMTVRDLRSILFQVDDQNTVIEKDSSQFGHWEHHFSK